MTDDRYGRFTSMAEAYRAGPRIGLQVGADNVRALLARRGELTAEMAGAIEALHGRPPLAEGPTAVDAELRVRGAAWSGALTETDGTVKPWDGSSYR